MVEDLQLRNRSPITIEKYVLYVAKFAKFFRCSPEKLTPEHVRQYQLSLLEKKVSWSTFNQSLCALRFTAHEFLRRFMLHVLPRGFVRIRSFGLLANRVHDEQLALCRQLLGCTEPETVNETSGLLRNSSADEDDRRCPACGQGTLLLVARTPRPRQSELVASTYQLRIFDSS
jgi:hypothetical protein